ncbi:MAG: ABC transporter permease subunit [Candidatus Caldarchaeum sp.]
MNKKLFAPVASVLGFLVVWEALARALAGLYIGLYIPETSAVLSEVAHVMYGQTPIGQSSYFHVLETLKRLLTGVFLGSLVGAGIGVVIGLKEHAENFFESWNWIFATIPAIMWAYIFILVMGASETTAVGVLAAVTYPQMAFRVSRGIRSVRHELVEMGKAFNAKTHLLLREVYFPQILPHVFSGLRYSLALGIKIIAIAELVGLSSGVGFIMQYWWDQRLVAPLLAWGSLLVFLGLFFEFGVFRILERRLFRWTGQS